MGIGTLAVYVLAILLVAGALIYVFGDMLGTPQYLYVTVFVTNPVGNATVNAYALDKDGARGELLAGPAQTDENGSAALRFGKKADYVLVTSAGGYYQDTPMPAGSKDAGTRFLVQLSDQDMISAVTAANSSDVSVTPFSDMAASLATSSMRKGAAVGRAVDMANAALSQAYGIRSVVETTPAAADDENTILLSARRQRQYGVLLDGFTQEAHERGARPVDLMRAFSKDWSDGTVDGMQDGLPVFFNASGKAARLSPTAGRDDLQGSIDRFMRSDDYPGGLPDFSISSVPVCANPDFYIATTNLPAWWNDEAGWYSMMAEGGMPPYMWKLKEGSALPSGFELSGDGNISGTGHLQTGSVASVSPPFVVEVTDSSSPKYVCDAELRIPISEKPPTLEPRTITCKQAEECSADLAPMVSGGVPPYHFISASPDRGDYPLGLSVGIDGKLSGKPSLSGAFAIGVCVIDLVGNGDCSDVEVLVSQKAQPVQTTKPVSGGNAGTCMPGHYATVCGGVSRCCLNDWVCCGGTCKPKSFC